MSKKKLWWQSAITQRCAATLSIAIFGFVAMMASGSSLNTQNLRTQTLDASTPPQYGYSFAPHGVNLGTYNAPASFTQIFTFERYDKTQLGNDNVTFSLLDGSTVPEWCTISPTSADVTEASTHTLTVDCAMGDAQDGYHSLLVISKSGSNEAQGTWATNSTSIEFTVQGALPVIPSAPSNLTGEFVPNGANGASVNLMWNDNSTDETEFKIYRRLKGSGTPTLDQSYGAGTLSVQVAAPVTTGEYEYYIIACNNSGCSLTSNTVNVVIGGETEPSTTTTPATTTTTPATTTTTPTQNSACMWTNNGVCIADYVWAYTMDYGTSADGKGKWCRSTGWGWECQVSDPNSTGTSSGSGSTSGTTGSTSGPATSTPSSTGTSSYYGSTCTNYQEKGLDCNRCVDSNNKVTSTSCWDASATASTAQPASVCTYSFGENNLVCNTCKNANGTVTNKSCWQESGNAYNSIDMGDSSQELAEKNATCQYKEQKVAGQNYNNWCEVCTAKSGDIVRDTCSNAPTYEATVTTTESEGCAWSDDDGDCRAYEDWGWVGAQWCTLHKDGAWECQKDQTDTEITSEDNIQNFADPVEVERQIKDLKENMRWREKDLKEFSRFDKRIQRKIKEFQRKVETIQKDMEWMTRDGMEIASLQVVIEKINGAIQDLNSIQPNVEKDRKAFEAEVQHEKTILEQMSKSTAMTWDQLDALQIITRKVDVYLMGRDAYDGKLSFYEMLDGYYEWLKEKNKLIVQAAHENVKLTDEQKADLEQGDKWFGELENLHKEFLGAASASLQLIQKAPTFTLISELTDSDVRMEAREFYDFDLQDVWNDLRWTRDGLNAHGWDNQILWESLENARQTFEAKNNTKWIIDEIQMVREMLDNFEKAVNVLNGKLDDSHEKKLKELREVLPKGRTILGDIERFMAATDNADPDQLQSYWDSLERLKQYVDPRVNDIGAYLQNNRDRLSLTDSDRQVLDMVFYGGMSGPQGPDDCRKCSRLYDVYTEDTVNAIKDRIRNELIDSIVLEIKASVMDEVVKYVEDEVAGRVYEAIINNFDALKDNKFGENFGNDLLENGSKVTEKLTQVEFDSSEKRDQFKTEFEKLETLKNNFKKLPMPNLDVANRVRAYWDSIQDALNESLTREELQDFLAEGQALYNEAEETKYVYHLGFKDVPYIFDDNYDEARDWYSRYVVEGALKGRWEGFKNENGELMYEFGPSEITLRAEAIKMVLSAFGYAESGSGQNWWDGWANRARELGASLVNEDLTRPVSRGEMMRLIYEVGHFVEPTEFNGDFPDVGINDDWKAAEAMSDATIFTGDGLTGNARLYDTLNRAESAAVINRAAQWKEDNEFLIQDVNRMLQRPSSTHQSLTFRGFLKALLPFFH